MWMWREFLFVNESKKSKESKKGIIKKTQKNGKVQFI